MSHIFIYSKYLPFGRFIGITLLFFVIRKMERRNGVWVKPELTERFKQHETIHVWQQMCIAVTTLLVVLLLNALGLHIPLWGWFTPLLSPFILYGVGWLWSLFQFGYSKAYRENCFEREAYDNEDKDEFICVPFSFLKYL